MIALATSLVAPRMYERIERQQIASDKQVIVGQINALRQRIQLNGWSYSLDRNADFTAPLPDGQPAFTLPSGWQIDITNPVSFAGNGLCTGGTLRFSTQKTEEFTLKLETPGCWIESWQ